MPTAPKNLRQSFELQRLQNRVFARLIHFHGRPSLPNCMLFQNYVRTFRDVITKLCRQPAEIMSMNIFRTLDNAKLKTENVRGFLNTVQISSVQLIHVNKFTPNELC
jgi:hypothetical protein